MVFSHAPTNGIEATFSRNRFHQNRIEECWHGVWGGYSYDSEWIGNRFARNTEGIAIERVTPVTRSLEDQFLSMTTRLENA